MKTTTPAELADEIVRAVSESNGLRGTEIPGYLGPALTGLPEIPDPGDLVCSVLDDLVEEGKLAALDYTVPQDVETPRCRTIYFPAGTVFVARGAFE